MKLSLAQDKNVHILSVADQIEPREAEILKAGVIKLFKDGKNRLIVHILHAKTMATEVVRTVVELNLWAKELGGQLVLVVADSNLRQVVASFSSPRSISVASDVPQALKIFEKPQKKEIEETDAVKSPKVEAVPASASAPATGSPGQGPAELLEKLSAHETEIKTLKASLKEKESGSELGALKKENADLKAKFTSLEQKLSSVLLERRTPLSDSGAMDKVSVLEKEIEDLVQKLEAATKSKAPS